MKKPELSDGVQKTVTSFSLINQDVSSLEGKSVTRKRKTRQDKTRQGKDEARQDMEDICR